MSELLYFKNQQLAILRQTTSNNGRQYYQLQKYEPLLCHTLDNNGQPTHYKPLPYKILNFYNHKQH